MCLDAIEKKVSSQLLDFQKYGVAFAISHSGRCMIADDMGLGSFEYNYNSDISFVPKIIVSIIIHLAGKTFQSIAVADFYKDDWPLLVVTTATNRDGWERHIRELLPWVPGDSIKCLVSTNDYIGESKVLITSYSLMDRNADRLADKHFGFVILVCRKHSSFVSIFANFNMCLHRMNLIR